MQAKWCNNSGDTEEVSKLKIDFIRLDLIFSEGAGGSGKQPMALNSSIDTGNLKTANVKRRDKIELCYKTDKNYFSLF